MCVLQTTKYMNKQKIVAWKIVPNVIWKFILSPHLEEGWANGDASLLLIAGDRSEKVSVVLTKPMMIIDHAPSLGQWLCERGYNVSLGADAIDIFTYIANYNAIFNIFSSFFFKYILLFMRKVLQGSCWMLWPVSFLINKQMVVDNSKKFLWRWIQNFQITR